MIESLLMQIDSAVYVELIKEVGITVGVIGGIVASVAAIIKNRSTSVKVDNAADEAIKFGQYMTTFGQKTVEQEERMKIMGDALIKLSPEEVKKFLAENKVTAEELTRLAQTARAQLEVLDSQIPKEAKASALKDLPR